MVLATHQRQFVDAADRVLMLDSSGFMQGFGTAAELQEMGLLEKLNAASKAVLIDKTDATVDAADVTVSATAETSAREGSGKTAEHVLVMPEDREIGVVSKA